MCGRSSLTKTEKELEQRFQSTFYSDDLLRYNPLPNYNVAPTQMLPVLAEGDAHHFHIFRWGLIPFWAKDISIGAKMINARSETLVEKPAFRKLLDTKRCIVPLDGFYEWQKDAAGHKLPFRIVTTDQDIFSAAGLYDTWVHPDTKEKWHTFTIITVPPNDVMQPIHDRMPAILLSSEESTWLDPELLGADVLSLLQPYPSEHMAAYRVSDKVNNVRNRDADVILPLDEAKKDGFQGTLF